MPMDNAIKAEVVAMFSSSSQSLKDYKNQVGAQQFMAELRELLTEGDMTTALSSVEAVVSAQVSNAPLVEGLFTKVLSATSVEPLIDTALLHVQSQEWSQAFAVSLVLLATFRSARGTS